MIRANNKVEKLCSQLRKDEERLEAKRQVVEKAQTKAMRESLRDRGAQARALA